MTAFGAQLSDVPIPLADYPAVEAWTNATLQNSWVAFGGAYATPGYRKDHQGKVYLRGLAKNGTVSAYPGTAIFTLPSGYRPPHRKVLNVSSNGAWGRIDVAANGVVSLINGTNAWVSFDGLSFTTT